MLSAQWTPTDIRSKCTPEEWEMSSLRICDSSVNFFLNLFSLVTLLSDIGLPHIHYTLFSPPFSQKELFFSPRDRGLEVSAETGDDKNDKFANGTTQMERSTRCNLTRPKTTLHLPLGILFTETATKTKFL